jgi:hypothetical protein
MANWHARLGDGDGNSFEIIYHVPIPNTNNRVGVNYRSALVNSGLGGTTRMTEGVSAGQISTAEKLSVTTGALYEFVEVLNTNPGETAADLQARIDARFAAITVQVQSALSKRLTYWGHDRNVP